MREGLARPVMVVDLDEGVLIVLLVLMLVLVLMLMLMLMTTVDVPGRQSWNAARNSRTTAIASCLRWAAASGSPSSRNAL